MQTSILNRSFTPLLTPFMESRARALMIVGCAVTQTLLVFFGLPSWQCPIRAATGIPCPGCGLSSAMVLLLRGRWLESFAIHHFAPLLALAFLVLVTSLLPTLLHQKAVNLITHIETHTTFLIKTSEISLRKVS